MKKLLGCALALFVSGCGSSTDFVVQNSAPNSASSTLSSLVTDPQGAAAQGVRVIAQERSSGRQFEGVTAPDGTILLSLPAGVYDVGLDREGDSSSATCFYGPVIVEGPVQRSFVLQSSGGLPAGRVFGQSPQPGATIEAGDDVTLIVSGCRFRQSETRSAPRGRSWRYHGYRLECSRNSNDG